jgi:hypothetical protein
MANDETEKLGVQTQREIESFAEYFPMKYGMTFTNGYFAYRVHPVVTHGIRTEFSL